MTLYVFLSCVFLSTFFAVLGCLRWSAERLALRQRLGLGG